MDIHALVEFALISTITIVLISLAIGLYLYIYKYKHKIEVTRNIHSAPSLPIIGHGHYFIGIPAHLMMKRIWSMGEGHRTLKVWLGTELNFIMSNLDDVETILGTGTHHQKANQYKALETWLREGLLISKGHKWFQRRRLLTSAFHFNILNDFIEVFDAKSRLMIERLADFRSRHSYDQQLELYQWISLCTLDVICGKYYT